ncbi:MAG: sensor histidine kinase [Candidatus Eisenbacteria bacterium]
MDRQFVELLALGFQACFTLLQALVYFGLWVRQRRAYFATWAWAWGLYAVRLVLIAAFIPSRHEGWLFAHEAVTWMSSLLLLFAALQFSRGLAWRPAYAWFGVASVVWAAIAIFGIHSMAVAGITSVIMLAGVTLWTGLVFWRHRRVARSGGATLLAVTFTLWGLHRLDYPLLRPLGTGVLFGVFADVLLIATAGLGTMFLALSEGRRALEVRTGQLEQLTRLLLRSQEDERRRIARELHDEAGQVLTAVKIELDLEGRRDASEMVGRALAQVRDLSNLLRPTVLDDLGLLPALRALVDDFGRRARVEARLDAPEGAMSLPADIEVAIYRVVQEALTNVARHSGARRVSVRFTADPKWVRVRVEDDGQGVRGELTPHLGLLGMQERVTALGGTLTLGPVAGAGLCVEAAIPRAAA